jgi:hypothetical protein
MLSMLAPLIATEERLTIFRGVCASFDRSVVAAAAKPS